MGDTKLQMLGRDILAGKSMIEESGHCFLMELRFGCIGCALGMAWVYMKDTDVKETVRAYQDVSSKYDLTELIAKETGISEGELLAISTAHTLCNDAERIATMLIDGFTGYEVRNTIRAELNRKATEGL